MKELIVAVPVSVAARCGWEDYFKRTRNTMDKHGRGGSLS